MKPQATPYKTVTDNLGRLNRRQLEDVAAQVAALLAVLEDEADEATALTSSNTGPGLKKGGQAGYIEHKTINGCGPYAYLRFWSGKTHKSTYLGKVGAKQ